jgi:hypothetical protein
MAGEADPANAGEARRHGSPRAGGHRQRPIATRSIPGCRGVEPAATQTRRGRQVAPASLCGDEAGASEFERRRAVDMFQTVKGRLLAALDAIGKELKATQ